MKNPKVNHTNILCELLHKFARSEIRAAHAEMWDCVKNNEAKKDEYIRALEYTGIDWVLRQRNRDTTDYSVFGEPTEIIVKGEKS